MTLTWPGSEGNLGLDMAGPLCGGVLSIIWSRGFGRRKRFVCGLAIPTLLAVLAPSVSLGQDDSRLVTEEENRTPVRDALSPEVVQVQGSRSRYAEVEGVVPAFTVDALQIERAVPVVLTDALRGVGSIHMQTTTPGFDGLGSAESCGWHATQ